MYFTLDFPIGKLNCRILSIEPNQNTESGRRYYDHDHFCTELHWVEAGSCDYICDKTRYYINAGQLIIIPPRTYHREANASKNHKKLSILLDVFDPKEEVSALESCFIDTFRSTDVTILPVVGTPL